MATLLVIDDSRAQRTAVRRALEGVDLFERVLEASDGLEGARLLLSEDVDVALLDLEMPGLDGEKLLRLNRGPSAAERSPVSFVFLTDSTNMERRARLIENGASDALTKPFHPADLRARLERELRIKHLQDELLEKNRGLAALSTHDRLTGLRTRRFAEDALAVEFLRARRYSSGLALLMADLDFFKRVNDEYGHPAGDAVLRGVADRIHALVRATDVACRYGGEEFVVLMPQNTAEGAQKLAERWRRVVEEEPFELPDGRSVEVTISIGVAELDSQMSKALDLVTAADNALYLAKRRGRNRVEVYSDESDPSA